ncbi:MAG: FHA domain-containing protein [Myxococcota bacterium]
MGIFEQPSTARTVRLRDRHLVGRSPRADLVLDDRRVSGEHAVIVWQRGWWVRDLGSRNGTFVAGRRLEAGAAESLATNTEVGFGASDHHWILTDDQPPSPWAEGPVVVHGTGEMLALPDPERPTLTVFRDARARWVAEDADGLREVADGDTVEVEDAVFVLRLPEAVPGTLLGGGAALGDLVLRFVVSHDEETTRLEVRGPAGTHDLGARSHHYLLLTLARARLADVERAVPPETHGWLYQPELARGLGIDRALVNLHVYRARQQLLDLGVVDAAGLVERRPATEQLRLGTDRVEVNRG